MSNLLALAERCEAIDPSHIGPMETLCRNIHDVDPHSNVNGSCKAYAFSIDDALTLVPDGWTFDLVQQLPPTRDTARAYGPRGQVTNLCYGATPALAICAAALRARAAQ